MKLSDSGIVHESECGNCKWKQTPIIVGGESDKPCISCNGTGTITRPATLEEVVEWVVLQMDNAQGLLNKVNRVTSSHRHGLKVRDKDLTELSNRQVEYEEALTISGGILKIKT